MTNTQRAAVIAASILAVVAIIVGFSLAETDPDGPAVVGAGNGAPTGAVERQIPPAGNTILQQERVAIDLAAGFSEGVTLTLERANGGVIAIIPDDELDHNEPLNEWAFTPGRDKVLDRLPPQEVCANWTFRRFDQPQTQSSRWCFNVGA